VKISIDEARHIARLSRLEFSEPDLGAMRVQLDKILQYIGKLNELDTSDIGPTSHILNLSNVTREDMQGVSLTVEYTLRNAPDPQPPFFRVPKIIE